MEEDEELKDIEEIPPPPPINLNDNTFDDEQELEPEMLEPELEPEIEEDDDLPPPPPLDDTGNQVGEIEE